MWYLILDCIKQSNIDIQRVQNKILNNLRILKTKTYIGI